MQGLAVSAAETPGAYFGSACMVHDLGPIELLDRLANARYAPAGLSGDKHAADRGSRKALTDRFGQLPQMDRVARGAEQDRWLGTMDQIDPGLAGHPSRRDHHATALQASIVGAPKADERAKRKSHQHPIVLGDGASIQNVLPNFDPPLPIRLGIEDHHRAASRAAGAMVSPVLLPGVTVMLGKPRGLVADPIGLAHQREFGELIERAEFEPIGSVDLAIERVVGQDSC